MINVSEIWYMIFSYLSEKDRIQCSMVNRFFRSIFCSKEVETCVFLSIDSECPTIEKFLYALNHIRAIQPSHMVLMNYESHHSVTDYVNRHQSIQLPDSLRYVSLGGYFMLHHFDWESLPKLTSFMYQPKQPIQHLCPTVYPPQIKRLLIGPYPKTIDVLPEKVEEVYLLRNRFFRIRSTCNFPPHSLVIHAPTGSQTQEELEHVIHIVNTQRETLGQPPIVLLFDVAY
jgi:F-box domain